MSVSSFSSARVFGGIYVSQIAVNYYLTKTASEDRIVVEKGERVERIQQKLNIVCGLTNSFLLLRTADGQYNERLRCLLWQKMTRSSRAMISIP